MMYNNNTRSYVLPGVFALGSFVARWFTDATCSATVCRATSELLSHVYVVVVIFLGIVAATKAKQIKDLFSRFYKAVSVMTNDKVKSE
jgi:atlastin